MSAGRYSGVGRADRWGGTGDITAGACVDRHGDHDGERSGCMAKCPAERRATFMDECMLPPLDEVEQPPLILRQDGAFTKTEGMPQKQFGKAHQAVAGGGKLFAAQARQLPVQTGLDRQAQVPGTMPLARADHQYLLLDAEG